MEKQKPPFSISEKDFPTIYLTADEQSLNGQRRYLNLMRLDLFALVGGAILTAFTVEDELTARILAIIGASLLLASLVLTIIITQMNYKKYWYGGRAAAESIKTLVWRYMTSAEPFANSLTLKEADESFLQRLRDIIEEQEHLSVSLGNEKAHNRFITDKMIQVRQASLEDRKQSYLICRIEDQRLWYRDKSKRNEKSESNFFMYTIVAQFLAFISALILIGWPIMPITPTGIFTTIAGAFLVWTQLKQHQELSQSYAVAAHELGLIAEQARYIKNEQEFGEFVADAENAISREHTLWLARRDQSPLLWK